jgi:hypothetical protein
MLFSGAWRLEMLENQGFETCICEMLENQACKTLDKLPSLVIIRLENLYRRVEP